MKSQCLPFAQIPHTTRLFTDFLSYSPAVQEFYPHSPHFNEWFKAEASQRAVRACAPRASQRDSRAAEQILERLAANSGELKKFSRRCGGDRDWAAGGLFGGPMFSIYKALSAVKLADGSRMPQAWIPCRSSGWPLTITIWRR